MKAVFVEREDEDVVHFAGKDQFDDGPDRHIAVSVDDGRRLERQAFFFAGLIAAAAAIGRERRQERAHQEQYGSKDRQHQLKTFHGRTTFRSISRSM